MRIVLPRRHKRRIPIVILFTLVWISSKAAGADWRFEAESGTVYESNISNSDRDLEDDWAWQNSARVSNGLQLTRDLRLSFGVDVFDQFWANFRDFNNFQPGGLFGLRYRFGLGRNAPWVFVEDHIGYSFFGDKDRSGLENRFRAGGGIALTDRLSLEAAYRFENFDARDPFWDWSGHTAMARLTFDLTSSCQIAVGYSYRSGEVISYALPPRPDLVGIASERESVDTFGFPNYTAYKMHGITNSVSASAAYTVNKYVSIVMSYEYRNTFHKPLEYEGHIFEAKVAFGY